MTVQTKICGLTSAPMVEVAIAAGADYLGFVLVERSPRFVSSDCARKLVEGVGGRVHSVMLVADPDDATVDLAAGTGAGWIQLHGGEPIERVGHIRDRSGLKVIKAIGVSEARDLKQVDRYADVADLVLLDAKPPEGSAITGGHGHVFDWSLLTGAHRPDASFMLSGGLTPENVADAIDVVKPNGVDVSSGVERARGEKSEALIAAFLKAARHEQETM